MPNFEDDSGNCHAPDPNGVACYKSRIGCPIHPRQKRKCHGGAKGQAMTDEKIAEIRDLHKYLDEYPNTDVSSGDLHHYLSFLLAEVERLREVTMSAAAALAAAIELLERGGKTAKKAAPSDLMFDQMLKDYRTVVKKTRKALGVKS